MSVVDIMDHLTAKERSENMSRIRSENTTPEKRVRSYLFRQGLRYRLHEKKLPGKPDIVLKRHKTCVFVHGCFWHHHSNCRRATIPKSNIAYWSGKLSRNVERDAIHTRDLQRLGWKVLTIWECETVHENVLRGLYSDIVQTDGQ
jgi:DNA mismatch endonuclease (patch repair protein)